MISAGKAKTMLSAIKEYRKRYLSKTLTDLDESGTRIMINAFLTSILGYKELEEIKTEYMIRGTYADYIVQIGGKRHFLVEVKAFSIDLSDKHLRQAINYGANEGIEWAILTNGRQFQIYKVLFEKPISEKLVFDIDFSLENFNAKDALEKLMYLHRDAVIKKKLNELWLRYSALEPETISSMLFAPQVLNFLKKDLKRRFKAKLSTEEVIEALEAVILLPIPLEKLRAIRFKKRINKNEISEDRKSKSENSNDQSKS
jgi:hypothetical protein